MKVKLDQKTAISTATLGVSAGVGALVSKGGMSIAPASFRKPIFKGILGVVALVAASTVQGQGTLETISKGVLLGVGIQQTAEAAVAFIKPTITPAGENPTMAKQFIAGAMAGVEDETFVLPQANLQRRALSPVQKTTSTFAAA